MSLHCLKCGDSQDSGLNYELIGLISTCRHSVNSSTTAFLPFNCIIYSVFLFCLQYDFSPFLPFPVFPVYQYSSFTYPHSQPGLHEQTFRYSSVLAFLAPLSTHREPQLLRAPNVSLCFQLSSLILLDIYIAPP